MRLRAALGRRLEPLDGRIHRAATRTTARGSFGFREALDGELPRGTAHRAAWYTCSQVVGRMAAFPPSATTARDRDSSLQIRAAAALPTKLSGRGGRIEPAGRSMVTIVASVSLERVHDLQFKRPTFMGSQDRRKIVDIERDPVDDQYDAAFAVRCDPSA